MTEKGNSRLLGRPRDADGAASCERAPIPIRSMIPWDNGRGVVLAGSAAGIVAPAFGEGIYHAMLGERLVAEAVEAMCTMAAGVEAVHE